jgi:hypothetical protein
MSTQGSNTNPVVRHCQFLNYDGAASPMMAISCTMRGRVDAGQRDDHGHSLFQDNEYDIGYANRGSNPESLYAVGNCWDEQGGEPDLWGNQQSRIVWNPPDCSGWGGYGVPPRPAEPTLAGLHIVYPNPGEDAIRIEYGIDQSSMLQEGETRVRLMIYDVSGRLVRELINERMPAGSYSVDWDRTGQNRRSLSPGAYVCRLETDTFVDSKRIILASRH